jgi:hypothetical protein
MCLRDLTLFAGVMLNTYYILKLISNKKHQLFTVLFNSLFCFLTFTTRGLSVVGRSLTVIDSHFMIT